MKLPEPTISLSLEGLLRFFRDNRTEHIDRISDYLNGVVEQSERVAAPWKNIAGAIEVQLSEAGGTAGNRSTLPDFCLVDPMTNIAGRAGMVGYYRRFSKALGGRLQQDAIDRLANGIGNVIQQRDAARSAYDELVRRSSIGEAIGPAELRGVLKHVEHLLTAVAELQAIIASTKVEL